MRAIILAIVLALAGCSSTHVDTTFHPRMPQPLKVCDIEWKVLIVDDTPYVALTYDDNVTAAMCFKEYERYIHQLMRVTCSYRETLNEAVCKYASRN